MSEPSTENETPDERRRRAGLLWACGVVAAAIMVLAVNGTLSSWSAAILTNDSNTAESTTSVVLEESGPDSAGNPTTCTTSGTAANTATCSTINKYGDGGVAATGLTALSPGDSISTIVTLTNTGSGDASTFTLTPGACSSVYNSGSQSGNTPAVGDDLCTQLKVAVSCTGSTLTVAATPLTTLAANGPYTLTTGLASGASATCTFTVSLPAATPANYSGQTVTQGLTWEIGI
ncbi:hypothetical protein [Nocardioides pocheonensis]|uniref:Uncharacterized protein n=1 Tax=Nocardioides pocheonensis TaxID=661485 RepID=A0A3N0GLA3_9ACTN|nr:hypothetical protein [Nocardioides pocheonensis]RNM13265.1 hypothetical protein EFL26_15730 [Nocardioides pocheonensis]